MLSHLAAHSSLPMAALLRLLARSLASPSLTMGLSDNDKLAFYAYFKQATHGDCPEPKDDNDISMMAVGGHEDHSAEPYLTVTKAKRDAWRRCAAMRRRDAMRAFVLLLDKAVPGWDSVPQAALPPA
jgi:acyl-CoA-binding protein